MTFARLIEGLTFFTGMRMLTGTFRQAAEQIEKETTLLTVLRGEILSHAIILAGPDLRQAPALEASIRARFAEGIAGSGTPGTRQALQEAFERWQAVVAAVGPLDRPAPIGQRGLALGLPMVSALLDRAGEASLASLRAELADGRRAEVTGTAALVALDLVVSALLLRFARRLSVEVLRPVGMLRDSVNHLAAGELDHRVECNRADELGDLATSFNAMADAISGGQRRLTHQANHDSLTGLVNRAAFHARLEAALVRPERRDGTQAVLFMDLDDFKDVNDTLGHAAGDELLCVVAARLNETVRPGDLVARLGGDEFALLLDGVPDLAVALDIAERAVDALAAPVPVAGTWVHVGASVGLAMRHDGSDPDGLMREADVAMYTAKGRGKNRVEPYDAALNAAVAEHHALKADVVGAAQRGELVLDYQPVVDLVTGRITAVEALVRWQHPTRGLLPPATFIGLAEQTGAIVGLGSWVLETAAHQLQRWQRRYGLPELKLSVNVSVCQLDAPGFAAHVRDVLRRTELDPGSLILEITESVLADPGGGTTESLAPLRELGVQVALDDFGTGYSSIAYLRELPVDILKIDRSFVSGDHANRPGDLLLEAIVGLAQLLGLDVIPEGIEEPDQLAHLDALGCRTGQGFLLSRPISAAAVGELLAATAALPPDRGSFSAAGRMLPISP